MHWAAVPTSPFASRIPLGEEQVIFWKELDKLDKVELVKAVWTNNSSAARNADNDVAGDRVPGQLQ